MTAKLTRQRTTVSVEVEVDVDITDLADNGWHHEDDCAGSDATRLQDATRLLQAARAIASLHRQAHPSQALDPLLCHEEPCRSVDGDLLRLA